MIRYSTLLIINTQAQQVQLLQRGGKKEIPDFKFIAHRLQLGSTSVSLQHKQQPQQQHNIRATKQQSKTCHSTAQWPTLNFDFPHCFLFPTPNCSPGSTFCSSYEKMPSRRTWAESAGNDFNISSYYLPCLTKACNLPFIPRLWFQFKVESLFQIKYPFLLPLLLLQFLVLVYRSQWCAVLWKDERWILI